MGTTPQQSDVPSFIREPVRWVKWWLGEKPPTNRTGAVTALWAIAAWLALTFLAGFIIHEFGPTGNVPGWVVVVVGGVCLVLGLFSAWLLTRKNYELLVKSLRSDLSRVEVEIERERERWADFEPRKETLRRLGIYSDHLYTLIGTMIAGRISLADLEGEAVARAICDVVATHLRRAAGAEFVLSVWGEPREPRFRERISHAVGEKLPDAVSDLLPAKRRFAILNAPDHTVVERKAFEVTVDPSWLKWNQRQEEDHEEFVVFDADLPGLPALKGDDIAAFVEHGYQSVRAIAFERADLTAYLVVLSKHPGAFSEVEDQYLMWLKRVLELDGVLADVVSSAAQGSDVPEFDVGA
jgi:hypothetical protein